MKQVSGKELARILQKRGWVFVRSKGSHYIFTKDGRQERIVITIHGNYPLKIGLLRSLMKIAELEERDV
jgi:predicted RNA binding protein YcfA (HicA-like mRNA interferase family)